MRKLRLLLAALFGVITPAAAQMSPIPGFPPGTFQSRVALDAAPASNPTLTYIGSVSPGSITGQGTTQENSSGVAIGTAAADRLVVIVENSISTNVGPITSAKISGITATTLRQGDILGTTTAIFAAVVPTGTTANVEVNWTSTAGFSSFDVYTITGLSSTNETGFGQSTNASATSLNTTLNTRSGGVVIVGSSQYGPGAGATTDSYSGSTLVYSSDNNGGLGNGNIFGSNLQTIAHNSNATTNAASGVTATWNGAAGPVSLAAVAWR